LHVGERDDRRVSSRRSPRGERRRSMQTNRGPAPRDIDLAQHAPTSQALGEDEMRITFVGNGRSRRCHD
jgi:hypothetical protein